MSVLPESIPCIVGGSPLSLYAQIPTIHTQVSSRQFAIYWSKEKRYGCLYPTPTADELTLFYSGSEEYDDYLSGVEVGQQKTPSLLERALIKVAWKRDHGQEVSPEFLANQYNFKNLDICDIGCGGGAFLEAMGGFGNTLSGIDPHPVAVKAASARGARVSLGTAENIPSEIPNESFDLVTMFHSLEHCNDPLLGIKNCLSLVKPGGHMLIDVPNHASKGFESLKQAWFHTDAGRHLFFFTAPFLREQIENAGGQIVKTFYTGYARQFRSVWVEAQAAVWDSICRGEKPGSIFGLPRRPSMLGAASLLLSTILNGSDDAKYDSFAVLVKKPAASRERSHS